MEEKQDEKQKDTPSVDYPKFGERPNTKKAYNFNDDIMWLPFKFNLGNAPFTKEQQNWLLNLVYNDHQVFSLHDEDLGFCNKLAHTTDNRQASLFASLNYSMVITRWSP